MQAGLSPPWSEQTHSQTTKGLEEKLSLQAGMNPPESPVRL